METTTETNTPETGCTCCCQASTDNDNYHKFLHELTTCWNKFMSEANEGFDNKAAALRARKASLTLRKNLQEFREVSIANDKKA